MAKNSRQIECLNRLNSLDGSIQQIVGFLREEKLITQDQMNLVRSSPAQGKELQLLLASLVSNEKLQLLEYQWSILPVEIITITIVTDSLKREFSYQAF